MPGDEIHDLLVKVRPDTGNTEHELDNVNEKFEETADETDRTAGMISDLSERLQGVAGIVVGTLVTLAAGLATQIPVIGETVSGLGAIIDAIALKIDEDLRPALSGFNRMLFDIADQLARSEGTFGDFVRAISRVNVAWDLLVPLSPLRLGIQLRAAVNDMIAIGSNLISEASSTFSDFTDTIESKISGLNIVETVSTKFDSVVSTIHRKLGNIATDFASFTANFVADAQLWLIDVQAGIERFIAETTVGFQTLFNLLINEAKRWGNAFAGVIESAVNAAIQSVPRPIRDALNLGPISIAQPFEARSRQAIMIEGRRRLRNQRLAIGERRTERRGGVQEQLARTLQALQNTTVVHETNLDGRQVAGSAADFLGEGTANIGRVNRSR